MTSRSQSREAGIVVAGTYENGVIRPDRPLPFKDSERVRITIVSGMNWAERTAGMVRWSGSADELERIAIDAEFDPQESAYHPTTIPENFRNTDLR